MVICPIVWFIGYLFYWRYGRGYRVPCVYFKMIAFFLLSFSPPWNIHRNQLPHQCAVLCAGTFITLMMGESGLCWSTQMHHSKQDWWTKEKKKKKKKKKGEEKKRNFVLNYCSSLRFWHYCRLFFLKNTSKVTCIPTILLNISAMLNPPSSSSCFNAVSKVLPSQWQGN